jgi:hypothetical protein
MAREPGSRRGRSRDGLRAIPVDELRLALILFVVVVCVMVATRPVPPRRRVTRTQARDRSSDPGPARTRHTATLSRNAWDRSDLARAVGLDFADPDNVGRYPTTSQPA